MSDAGLLHPVNGFSQVVRRLLTDSGADKNKFAPLLFPLKTATLAEPGVRLVYWGQTEKPAALRRPVGLSEKL